MEYAFPEEVAYLAVVKEQLIVALNQYDKSVTGYDDDYNEARRYLAKYWNELDPMERFSNDQSLVRIEAAGNNTLALRAKVRRLIDTPYFARIDFQFEGEEDAEAIYIGIFGFTGDQHQTLIYDWRAPISNMYYEYQTGPASYEAPTGSIYGEITRKRQIKIKRGNLEYVLESSMNIDDDILRKELSSTSDEKMKNIITTIQKEQNQIIRNDNADVLIIQGVAGSGKTSIALHRVAFLLYRHKERLTAQNVAIISPNKVFADYISNVLPELGEEPILELSFENIAKRMLCDTISFECYAAHAEDCSPVWLAKLAFKSSLEFVGQIDEYLKYAEQRYFKPRDCIFGGITISADYIQKRYHAYGNRPILQRFPEMANDILETLKTGRLREAKLPTKGEITRKLRAMFKMGTALDLYQDFYRHWEKPELFELAAENTLEWPDVFPYIYMLLLLEGTAKPGSIQHLVIDEMQDYAPVQYAVLNRMYRCKKTILGDISQSVIPQNTCSPEAFSQLFNKATFVSLTKSYRSTYEIIELARSIKSDQFIEPVERHGEVPTVSCCDKPEHELAAIREKLETFMKGTYATMGILCKNLRQASSLYESLSEQYPVRFLNYESSHFENGIHITSIPLSKGLEFDEVVIPFVNADTYHSEFDQNLLYIACTRAMHKLSLTHCGNISALLQK